MKRQATRPGPRGSIFPPPHPPGAQVLVKVSGTDLSLYDRSLVALSSLVIVGSFAWVPLFYVWAWRRYRAIPKTETRKRALYASILSACLAIQILGPHRYPRVGEEWLKHRQWSLWKSWFRYIAFEVVADSPKAAAGLLQQQQQNNNNNAIVAVSPHGLFPFALAFAALPQQATEVFGYIRPVVATATNFFPFVNTLLKWLRAVDASRSSVNAALASDHGGRIGLAPGGIAEMFEGYPKPGTLPDEEYMIGRHRGFLKLAVQHNLPVIPVYCFGASKMLRRLQLPAFFEKLSKLLRTSVVIMFGAPWGLPIPFRQKLKYVVGEPIYPSSSSSSMDNTMDPVEDMHARFCDSMANLFERHKESYGWGHKTFRIV